mmetsp:Transcript_44217/g.88357  ORF Transcript_44217/g.88357 Transcript_44217/m.88357 type:complete len:367 (-) Transcript_44217:91-1191(-)|eukprot:CAMPEP_0174714800 /NCGR_PEP_ID=MMETSP1094-20130205/19306_1 /TAXON_ID=156173 /ORGANISM="Chrysochromulina brevifilum, Strain UTEX LB 985" /LENGTH=366 /DNA_ID=CAMNT_0015914239 /DNA_START=87 /DNA_END=1187 /DNA_ORIENTATION=+
MLRRSLHKHVRVITITLLMLCYSLIDGTGASDACWCFDICSAATTNHFLRRLPIVTSTQSPWYKYLTAVYKGAVLLPFDLKRLRMFWYDSSWWRERSPQPTTGLPFKRCSGRVHGEEQCCEVGWGCSAKHVGFAHTKGRCSTNRSNAAQSRCPQAFCDLWLLPEANGSESVILKDGMPKLQGMGFQHPMFFEFTIIDESPLTPYPNNSWVEVMRADAPRSFEGMNEYGCWFYTRAGSGMFINVGQTTVVERNLDLPYPIASVLPKPLGLFKEVRPSWSHRPGFDSLQILGRIDHVGHWGHRGAGLYELVMVTNACAHRESPIKSCPPAELEIRTQHKRLCKCDDTQEMMNCEPKRVRNNTGGVNRV